ncbi:MAG TPA: HNH endonuclease family protein, partial [Bryobacteraceae bacterium]
DEKSVYTVFEVLNSRGLDVSWLDRLKSLLMGAAFELKGANRQGLIDDLHHIWRKIYTVIGLRQGMNTEALRFAATLRSSELPNRPISERDSVECINALAVGAQKIRDAAGWLLRVTEACDSIFKSQRLNAVTRISQARLLATAIHLRDDLSEGQRSALLARWENVSFRIYGVFGNDARLSVGDYVRLAWRTVNENLSPAMIDAGLVQLGENYRIKDYFDDFKGASWYEGCEAELRYFMYRYEEHLAHQRNQKFSNEQWERIWMVSPSESIEHIWPASKAPGNLKHSLGNLILLPPGLNSSLQDKPPKEKASEYRKTGLLIASEVADLIEGQGWSRKVVESREKALLEWASQEWDE